jgi:hypothetical protein
MTTDQLDELQRNIVGSLMSLLDGNDARRRLSPRPPRDRCGRPRRDLRGTQNARPELAELAALHHIKM